MNIVQSKEGWSYVEGDEHFGKWIVECQRLDHDFRFLEWIWPHIPSGGCVVDVGANIGSHTIVYMRAVGNNGQVIAFEPHPSSFECLKRNCRKEVSDTGNSVRMKLINAAVGSSSGRLTLSSPETQLGTASITANHGISVEVLTLDASVLRADLIKMDIEGFEMMAIEGATALIERYKPKLVLEVNDPALRQYGLSSKELLQKVESLGYVYEVYETNLPRPLEFNPQFNILCTPK